MNTNMFLSLSIDELRAEVKKAVQDIISEQAKLNAELERKSKTREVIEQKEQEARAKGNEALAQLYAKQIGVISKSMDGIQTTIEEKASPIGLATDLLKSSVEESMSNLFQDDEALKEPWRRAFNVIAGALKQLASAAITELILGQLGINAGATGLAGLLVVPFIKGLANTAVSAILNPILQGLTSFATGGEVTEPTIAVVGDAKQSGHTTNTEWIFNSTQMQVLVAHVLERFGMRVANEITNSFSGVADKLQNIEVAIKNLQPVLKNNNLDSIIEYFESHNEIRDLQLKLHSGAIDLEDFRQEVKLIEVPKLATGGIATTETLAVVGDGPGAEAIIPLEELPKFVGQQNNYDYKRLEQKFDTLIVEVRKLDLYITENEIYEANNRESNRQKRRLRNG